MGEAFEPLPSGDEGPGTPEEAAGWLSLAVVLVICLVGIGGIMYAAGLHHRDDAPAPAPVCVEWTPQ